MSSLVPIQIPLINPNEPDSLLASLEVIEGESLQKGQVVALVETTKSTGEVAAEKAGYLVGLRFKEGDTLKAGAVLAYIGESPQAMDPSLPPWAAEAPPTSEEENPEGLRITAPARELALEMGVDLATLPYGPLVTRRLIEERLFSEFLPNKFQLPKDERRLLIFGAGGHGRSLAELIRVGGEYEIIGFLDDGFPVGESVMELRVLGGHEALHTLRDEGICLAVNGVGGIGDLVSRLSVQHHLARAGFHCPTVIHTKALIEASAELEHGVQVFPFAYVGSQVVAGFGSIINTGAIVSHDCKLARFVNLSPGATLAGGVSVGEGALIGMRATVNLGVAIGRRARVGNGATIKADVPDEGVVPAGTIWPPRR